MPIGEIETHPYLKKGHIESATKLILGSFPVYECTDPDNHIKQQNRQGEGTIRFFYGSVDSSLWMRYSTHVDPEIHLPPNEENIISSLTANRIAIADTITCCQRHDFSSEDTKLVQKTWNRQGILRIVEDGVSKILCTSKGVLSDLEKKIICPAFNAFGSVDLPQSATLQNTLIKGLGGNLGFITNPIAKVFVINGRRIEAMAIPSPGSPQRQIREFGFDEQNWQHYANRYFATVFTWLAN